MDDIVDSINKLKGVQITSLNDEEEVHIDNEDEYYDDYDDDGLDDLATLGFVENPENEWSLYRQCFPSKVGSVPAWLDPINIPSGGSYMCDLCGEPLQFLLQVYAPCMKESAYHRMLFVFMCPSMRCLLQHKHEQQQRKKPARRSVKVFRCQLPRLNPLYSSDHPKYDGSDKPACSGAALCDWCDTWKGDQICSGCRQVCYCSKKHQDMHWRSGHKIACQKMKVSSQTVRSRPNYKGTTSMESNKVPSNTMWPEFEIISDNESNYNRNKSKSNDLANSLISTNKSDETMNSLCENFQGDESWANFQDRIRMAPEQVLRYYRDTKAKPIWPISKEQPSKYDIPKCCYCGGALCCEFQIMPQLLYYFDVDNEPDSLDWATIVVYTCAASCDAVVAYKNEYAWVQLISPLTKNNKSMR